MKKAIILVLLLLGLIGVAARVLLSDPYALHSRARKAWKEKTVLDIARRAADTNWVAAELGKLSNSAAQTASDEAVWFSDHLIRMSNGEWIVYDAKCRKEDGRIYDIFIGRGSDGKWYYSTFHFCIGMLVLRMEERSADLASFAKTFFLRESDGRSNECLEKTWPPKRK